MAQERLMDAIARIDTALARIEAAAARGVGGPPGPAAEPDLAARHARLRAATGAAIARLDELIDAGDPA